MTTDRCDCCGKREDVIYTSDITLTFLRWSAPAENYTLCSDCATRVRDSLDGAKAQVPERLVEGSTE